MRFPKCDSPKISLLNMKFIKVDVWFKNSLVAQKKKNRLGSVFISHYQKLLSNFKLPFYIKIIDFWFVFPPFWKKII